MKRIRWAAFATFALAVLFAAAQSSAKDKIRLEKLDDLPRHTYPADQKPSEILASSEAVAALGAKVKADVQSVLDTYQIDDKKTLQGFYSTLQQIAFLEGDYETSARYLEMARELEDKEAQKLLMGNVSYAYVDALKAGEAGSDAFRAALQSNISARLQDLPWDVVQDMVQMLAGQMQIMSENLVVGMIQSQLDPAVEKAGHLSGDQAKQIIGMRNALVAVIPYKAEIGAAYGAFAAAHQEEVKPDIWPDREVSFTGEEGYAPVVVGVWDSGVDVDVFKDIAFVNIKETADGKDNDKNGFVDDLHGIAYDNAAEPTGDLLYPLGEYAQRRVELEDQVKGFTDLSSGIQSQEATELQKTMSALAADEVKPYMERLSLYTMHSHGTHVAGIATAGNPYARVLVARLSFDHRLTPDPWTMDLAKNWAKLCKESVEYFEDHNVRVVNMSWGLSIQEIEHTLEVNGLGKDAEDRAKMAREMFAVVRKGLHNAMKGAPDILFAVAAGNSDNDVEFDEFIPSGFDLPNVIVSGAVDQAGEATGFTSFGETVKVYANGFEVDSFVPGGRRLALSGTSMASPNVANLAAKLIARDPSLSPQDVVRLIKEGTDAIGKDKPLPVINPKKSMGLLEERHHTAP